MGSDGKEGAKQLKQKGADVWSQDEKSCVVYGMPQAVASAGLSDRVLSLDEIGPTLARVV
jgi:two-component system chemotaxis response regulator CheB